MSEFFQWKLVWEYFPKVLSALPVTLMIVAVASITGLLLGFYLHLFVSKSAISESTGGSLRFIYSRHTDIGSTVCCVLWCTRLITNDSNRCFLME